MHIGEVCLCSHLIAGHALSYTSTILHRLKLLESLKLCNVYLVGPFPTGGCACHKDAPNKYRKINLEKFGYLQTIGSGHGIGYCIDQYNQVATDMMSIAYLGSATYPALHSPF